MTLGRPVGHLEPLVRVVHEGDLSPPRKPTAELAASRSEGFHFHLKQARARGGDDLRLYGETKGWLGRYDREERAKSQPLRTPGPNRNRWTRADVKSPNASAGLGVPQSMTSMPTGEAGVERSAHDHQTSADVLPPRPSPLTGDDGLLALEGLLLEYACLCQRHEASGRVAECDSADRVAAIRGVIADRLTRSEPGSKAGSFLRGLRVLVEVERIAPGHLADRRREAQGWSSPLSLARGTPGREAIERVAPEYGVDAGTLTGAVRLAEAVELIARNCGVGAFGLMLTPGGRLGEGVVLSIARKGPERQRYAMAEAAQGRDPMARPVAGVWPMDTRDFAKVPGRLGRALGAVDGCIAFLPALLEHQQPSSDEVAALRRHSTRVVECSEQLFRIVEGRGAGEAPRLEAHLAARERTPEVVVNKGPIGKSGTFAQVRGRLDAAHYFVEKTARDVAKMPTGLRPTLERASQIRGQLLALIGRAGLLIEVIGAGCPRRQS